MKYVKMLGLAAVAAAALMAFVGASSASATVLCTTPPVKNAAGTENATCPEGWAVPAGSEIHAVSEIEEPTLTGGEILTVHCPESTVKGKTENEGSATETVKGPIEVLTFGPEAKCNCKVVVVKPGSLEIHWIKDTTNGTLTSSGATVTINCSTIFGTIHCNFVTENTDIGTLTSTGTTGGTPTLDVTASIPQEVTSSLCPSEGVWHAKYSVTTPMEFWVANET
jgi:hypothetical protein